MSAGGAPAAVRIALLGGFTVAIDGVPVDGPWRLRKAKTLVKLLALAPGHQLHRDAAIGFLWPDSAPAAAVNNLHQAVHAARRVLGAQYLTLRDDLLLLAGEGELTVDIDGFQRLAERGRATNGRDDLRAALDAWTGPLLPEDAYEHWCEPHRDRLDQLHAATATLLAELLVAAAEPGAALAILERIAGQRPLDEPMQRARIAALDAAGRKWDAIDAYERLQQALDAQYAAEPDAQSKALYRRLLAGGAAGTGSAPHNLPEPVSSFVGRQRELRELERTLERTRLLTLTGPGGAGKSRLALELARRVAGGERFRDGVWLVELAGVKEDELVTPTTAAALGLALPGGAPSQKAVTNQLATRSLLLVLDNCEHVLPAAATLATEILQRCPEIVVATTSREPLALAGETVYRVPSLDLPEVDGEDPDLAALLAHEAVQLFVERARQTQPSFELDAGNAAGVARICYRLDGMPLALELAAARLAHLSVSQLADGLTDALTLLARGGSARLDRRQTLAAALDWSHDLLDADEQRAFRRLAVFAGGFDLDAARHVVDADLAAAVDLVSRLVDKSLVEADTSGRAARYRLLEIVRQYADGKLLDSGEADAVAARHRDWYAAAASEHDPDRGPVVGMPSRWFDVEQDNLRAALASALKQQPSAALQLAVATWRFWVARGLIAEAARWLTLALRRCQEQSVLRARALSALAVVQVRQGAGVDLHAIGDEVVQVLDAHGDPVEAAFGRHQRALLRFVAGDWDPLDRFTLERDEQPDAIHAVGASAEHAAGVVALSRGDVPESLRRFEAAQHSLGLVPVDALPYFNAVTLAWMVDERAELPLLYGEDTLLVGRRIGAEQAVAHVLIGTALAHRLADRTEEALELLADARARYDAIDDAYGQAYAAAQRGHTLRWAGDFDAADDALAESEALRRAMRDQRAVAMSLGGRSLVAAASGAGELARLRGREAVRMMERSGDTPGVALTATDLGSTELMLGNTQGALYWFGRAADLAVLPGGHRAHGWLRLLQALLLAELGAHDESADACNTAHEMFLLIGEQSGLAAMQRARKAGRLNVAGNEKS